MPLDEITKTPLILTDNLRIVELNFRTHEHRADRFLVETCFPHLELPISKWRCGLVRKVCGLSPTEAPIVFAVSPRALLWINIHAVPPVDSDVPRRMKARDILQEIWGRYRGSLDKLETVGYAAITNEDVRAAMQKATLTLERVWGADPIFENWITAAPGVDGWEEAGK